MVEAARQTPEIRQRPPKAIPDARDRFQSRGLTWILATAISASIVFGVLATGDQGGRYKIAGVSLGFALIVAVMRSATIGGVLCGALVCFCMTWWTRDIESPLLHSSLLPLMELFVLTFVATRAGRRQKQARGLAEPRSGRTSAQVLANLGSAALIATPLGAYVAAFLGISLPIDESLLFAACLAALAEATADTVSSEVGQAFASRTYMLTSLRRVHRGTDGGVSVQGTAAGMLAALLVVLLGGWSLNLGFEPQALAWLAALIGLFADSLLGATVERRGWIGNDVVNLASTSVSSLSILVMARLSAGFR